MKTGATARAILSLAVAAGLACTPDFPAPFWKGEYLEYASTTDTEVCQGSWVVQDAYVKALIKQLGVTLSGPLWFAFIRASELEEYCYTDDLKGCSYDGKSFSTTPVLFHELAHEAAKLNGFRGPNVFQEGYAEVFGNGLSSDDTRLPIDQVLHHFERNVNNYYTAGLFVRFLIERDGLDVFLAFMKRTDRDDSFDRFSAIFEEEFGDPLAMVTSEFDDYPSCSMWNNRIAVLECGLPAVPWQDGTWEASSSLDCGAEDVLGPIQQGDAQLVWTTRGMAIDEGGDYLAAVAVGPEGTAGARITRCGSCWDSVEVLVKAGEMKPVTLPAGQYYVTLVKELEAPGDISLRFFKAL